MALRVYHQEVHIEYIKFFLSVYINRLKSKAKSMIPGISRDDVLDILLPLPPSNEQKRIIEKLEQTLPQIEQYGKYEEQLTKLNEELPEKLKKSILQQVIQGKLVPQNPEVEP